MRTVLGLFFRGTKTTTVLHSQAPALHPPTRVHTFRTNNGQRLNPCVRCGLFFEGRIPFPEHFDLFVNHLACLIT